MSPTWQNVSPADLAKIQASIRDKARKAHPLGKPEPVNKGGRDKEGEGFRARDLAKRRAKRAGKPQLSEAVVLKACIAVLEHHPAVALWWRQNTGAGELASGRYVKFSFRGASDLMGVLIDGRFLACECKGTGRPASADQRAFLDNVGAAGGAAILVDDPEHLLKWLNALMVPA